MRVAVMAYLKAESPKTGRRFVAEMARIFASEAELENVLPISVRDPAAARKARRQALAMFRAYLPLFTAGLKD